MTVLHPNSRLGRAIRSGKLKAARIDMKPGEDAGDAFVRGFQQRNPKAWSDFEAFVGTLLAGRPDEALMPKLTAQQALTEISSLLSTTEGDVSHQIKVLLACVPEDEQPELKRHPLYRNLRLEGDR